jgi:hypothetical protein
MEKKKALLVVAGGRAVPDVLVLFWVKPELVRVITSKEGWDFKDAFCDIARSMGCQVDIIPDIDAYNFDTCLQACQDACEPYPDTEWDWAFSIGSSPKITGIAAYEIAKNRGISCWHADAQRERAVSLIKPVAVDNEKFFHLTLDDYIQIQHKIWELGGLTDTNHYRDIVKDWSSIARELVISNPSDARALLSILYAKGSTKRYRAGEGFDLPPNLVTSPTLKFLADEGLLKVRKVLSGKTMCSFASEEAAQFIGTGDWLEFYVWHTAITCGLADEKHCQWGCKVKDDQVYREFDLMLIYKAQLILAECKAEKEPFKGDTEWNPFKGMKDYLGYLNAKANVLGGSYVSKLFITNQPAIGASYQSFIEQAKQYKIVVVTAENLHEIGQILKREAERPTYQRI